MKKNRKMLGIALAGILALVTFLSNMPVKAASKSKAPAIPQIEFVSAPTTEYKVGDRVRFDISTPNFGGKVEYRVVLWEDSKKTYHDLWNLENGYPTRYYSKWQPWGNNVFTLGWPISEAGDYRITVYVKRVGISNEKTFLKGQNCDSYKESIAFTVKPSLSVLDKDGQTYGANDINNPVVINNDVNITAKNVTLNNAKVEGSINVTGDNVTIKNVTISEKLVLDPGKEGSATLENVTAKSIEVLSGGTESIHIKNVNADTLIVNGKDAVRVETDGDTEIVSTTANGYVIFDKKLGTFGTITITKDENGETVVEFRGDIQDKVVVETQATITTTEGSKLENLVIATENTTDKVVLQGTFANVEVSKPVSVEIATGTSVTNVEVMTNAEVTVANGAAVQTLDTNNNTVTLDNQGTIVQVISTSGTGSTGGSGDYVPPPAVTNENAAFNTVLNSIITDMNKYSLSNSVFGTINGVPASGLATPLLFKMSPSYLSMNFGTITSAVTSRVITHGAISEQRDLDTLSHMNSLLNNVSLNGQPLKTLASAKLSSLGKPKSAAFISNMSAANYNELYNALKADPTLGSYENVISILHALIPGDDVTINSLSAYGLTVQQIGIGGQTLYDVKGIAADKKLTLLEIRTALGLSATDDAVKLETPSKMGFKSMLINLKGSTETIYTYTILLDNR